VLNFIRSLFSGAKPVVEPVAEPILRVGVLVAVNKLRERLAGDEVALALLDEFLNELSRRIAK